MIADLPLHKISVRFRCFECDLVLIYLTDISVCDSDKYFSKSVCFYCFWYVNALMSIPFQLNYAHGGKCHVAAMPSCYCGVDVSFMGAAEGARGCGYPCTPSPWKLKIMTLYTSCDQAKHVIFFLTPLKLTPTTLKFKLIKSQEFVCLWRTKYGRSVLVLTFMKLKNVLYKKY